MKILHVVPSFGFGGMERVICSLINHTSAQYEHEVLSLFGSNDAQRWIRPKSTSIRRFKRPKGNFGFFTSLYRALNDVKPDILMTYNWGATDAIWLGRIAGIKTVIHNEHGFNVDEARYTSLKRNVIRTLLYHISSGVIVVSKNLERMMQEKYFIKSDKVVLIPNGINTDYYSPCQSSKAEIRKYLKLNDEDVVAGFSGRLDPVKNFDYMLEVIEICIRRNSRLKLLIVGDGPERAKIEALCVVKNIQDKVILVGQKENILPYLRAMDVFLLTSLSEQMPLTILEAMSVGLPIMATKVGEIPQIVENEREGFVMEVDEAPANFANALLTLTDRRKLAGMAGRARRKIVANFPEQAMVEKYVKTIERVSQTRNRNGSC